MAELLFEVWASPSSIECARVSRQADRLREQEPDMVFEGSFYASSHEDSMRQHYARQDWGEYQSVPGFRDVPFSDAERADQDAYLLERKSTAKPSAERE